MSGIWTQYKSLYDSTAPSAYSGESGGGLALGVQVVFGVPGRVVGCRWYRDRNDDGYHYGAVRSADNSHILGFARFHQEAADDAAAPGWRHAYFRPQPRVAASDRLIIVVHSTLGFWWYTPAGLLSVDIVNGPLTAPHYAVGSFNQGVFNYNGSDGTRTDGNGAGSQYGVDVLFLPDV